MEMTGAFAGWAICELMGRRRIAGYVTADGPLLTATRLQVEIYDGDAAGPAAVQYPCAPWYCVTPCTEETARRIGADALRNDMPVPRWSLPDIPALPAAGDDSDGGGGEAVLHDAGCQDPLCDGECIQPEPHQDFPGPHEDDEDDDGNAGANGTYYG
jgi:hypothetical protein